MLFRSIYEQVRARPQFIVDRTVNLNNSSASIQSDSDPDLRLSTIPGLNSASEVDEFDLQGVGRANMASTSH